MTVPTVAIACQVSGQDGMPIPGAVITAKLDQTEYYDGVVVPEVTTVTADEDGLTTLNLWPNELGALSSSYTVTITNPENMKRVLRARGVVPNEDTTLDYILRSGLFQSIAEIAQTFSFPLAVSLGGTGATNAADTLAALGLAFPLPQAQGGTGLSSTNSFATQTGSNVFNKHQRGAPVELIATDPEETGIDTFNWTCYDAGDLVGGNNFYFRMTKNSILSSALGGPASIVSFIIKVDGEDDLTLELGDLFSLPDDTPLEPLAAGKTHLLSCIRDPYSQQFLAVLAGNFTGSV